VIEYSKNERERVKEREGQRKRGSKKERVKEREGQRKRGLKKESQ
jgi:hypothetical protein